jgi:class 3 adenylate cyclase
VPPLAERRQLTVLCCKLVRVAQLAVQLDPEDLHALLHTLHATCADIIAQLDGSIAQQLDADLVKYFGYPHAHEDAAQRVVRTGLRLGETLRGQ